MSSLARRGRTLSWTADLLGLGALASGVTALVLGLRTGTRGDTPATHVFIMPARKGPSLTAVGIF